MEGGNAPGTVQHRKSQKVDDPMQRVRRVPVTFTLMSFSPAE